MSLLWLFGCEAVSSDPTAPFLSIPLGHLPLRNRLTGEQPEAVLAFDPSGERLAVGTGDGVLRIVDVASGVVTLRLWLSPGPLRALLFTDDDLWVAEQSPDAWLRRLDPATGDERARLRLADQVGSGALPAPDDVYGIYALPSAYGLAAAPDGDLFVTAVHGWAEAGARHQRSRVLRVDGATLEIEAGWPADGAIDAALFGAEVGDGLAVALRRGTDTPRPLGVPPDGLMILDDAVRPVHQLAVPALRPWFDLVFIWDTIAWTGAGWTAGTGDGRLVAWQGDEPVILALSTPSLANDVPLVAPVVSVAAVVGGVVAATGQTGVPWGSAPGVSHPPDDHDGADSVFWVQNDPFAIRWTWSASAHVAGVWPDHDVVWVSIAGSPDRRGVVSLRNTDGHPTAILATEGLAGALAVSADRTVAVVESPDVEGSGAWRLVLFK